MRHLHQVCLSPLLKIESGPCDLPCLGGFRATRPDVWWLILLDAHVSQMKGRFPAGQKVLVVKAGKDSVSTVLEVWESSRLAAELQVPAKLHESVYNDGWFSTGAVWDSSETRIAYVAEVRALIF